MHEDLIVSAMPAARTTALVFQRTCQRHLDPAEAVSIAYLELVKLADRFDPTRGVTFWTFAQPRIIGALTDYLRTVSQFSAARLLKPSRPESLSGFNQKLVGSLGAVAPKALGRYDVLKKVLAQLDAKDRKIILTYAEAPRKATKVEDEPANKLGLTRLNFYNHRVRILTRLRAALIAQGVTKVADVL